MSPLYGSHSRSVSAFDNNLLLARRRHLCLDSHLAKSRLGKKWAKEHLDSGLWIDDELVVGRILGFGGIGGGENDCYTGWENGLLEASDGKRT